MHDVIVTFNLVENSSAKPLDPNITKCKLLSDFIIHCLLLPDVGLKIIVKNCLNIKKIDRY